MSEQQPEQPDEAVNSEIGNEPFAESESPEEQVEPEPEDDPTERDEQIRALREEARSHRQRASAAKERGDKMEGIIRMATELGAARVVPLVTARTVVRVEPGRPGPRLSRWQRVAKEAAKQSGRALITEVTPPQRLAAWIATRETDGLLVCLWEDAPEPLGPQLPPRPVSRATVVVGPEGGLERAEADALLAAGAVVVGLGPRILRTETAGPVGLAILQARYGDLGGGGS